MDKALKIYLIMSTLGFLFIEVGAVAATTDFSRYAQILERRPFLSPLPEVQAPAVTQNDAPPAFVKELRMVAITESPAGVRVGFVNIRQNPPKVYYLYVGDQEDGMTLVDADFNREKALLRKGGQEYWIRMGGGDAVAAANESTPAPRAGSATSGRGGIIRRTEAAVPSADLPSDSYAARRQQRLEEMRRRAEESRKLSEAEIEAQLRAYQMKLIREGKTPLPIPITEEMDAQLVAEGILPPVE